MIKHYIIVIFILAILGVGCEENGEIVARLSYDENGVGHVYLTPNTHDSWVLCIDGVEYIYQIHQGNHVFGTSMTPHLKKDGSLYLCDK